MSGSFEAIEVIPATPAAVYAAWLSSEGHSAMTGAPATCSDQAGGSFDAWDGYITGRNLELDPGRRIVQSWRAADFPDAAEDSTLEVTLTPVEGGTQLILRHSNLPGDGESYRQGWVEWYFEPMKRYFAGA
jgi:uncharacterized protein YndB with AHSA1/START domain